MLEPQLLIINLSRGILINLAKDLLPSAGDIKEYLKDNPEARKKAVKIIWIISIILMLLITVALIFGVNVATGNYKLGIFISIIIWAIFFGITALLFLPSKVVTTVFGGFLGTSISEIGDASGLITAAKKSITDITTQVGVIVGQTEGKVDPFISSSVWTFVIIVTLLCLPAFFSKD